MIEYRSSASDIGPEQLAGFFEGWPTPPSAETHLAILRGSDEVVLALDAEQQAVVGFVTVLTDRVLSAYIPLLEVRADHRGQGIGGELIRRALRRLPELYMIDVTCDPHVQPFYESLGFLRSTGASLRRYENQAGGGR
jgi:GNAT superfamily N-acetyltransferase